MFIALQVTSLSGITRRDRGCVHGSSEPAPFASGFAESEPPAISGDRMEKRPLTHQPKSFAVRHRLLSDSLASPRGPFMVELFTASGFAAGRRTSHVRFGLSPGSKLPTPARLNEVLGKEPRTPVDGITLSFTEPHPL